MNECGSRRVSGHTSPIRNAEGYIDRTAAQAIQEADKPPADVVELVYTLKRVAELAGYEVFGRIWLRDKGTGREWR